MQAIVSALDDPYRDYVENIWGELKAVFGLQGLTGSTTPHITWHVAGGYDEALVDGVLTSLAGAASAVAIETHGLGVFESSERILYLHVTAAPALVAVHRRLWDALAPIATDVRPVYAPETWLPHVTFAAGDIAAEQLAVVLQFLNRRDYHWKIPLTNVALIPYDDAPAPAWRRFDVAAG